MSGLIGLNGIGIAGDMINKQQVLREPTPLEIDFAKARNQVTSGLNHLNGLGSTLASLVHEGIMSSGEARDILEVDSLKTAIAEFKDLLEKVNKSENSILQ